MLPEGTLEEGETAQQAAVRECAEETGLAVAAELEIGRRTHEVTGQQLTYIARCSRSRTQTIRSTEPSSGRPTTRNSSGTLGDVDSDERSVEKSRPSPT